MNKTQGCVGYLAPDCKASIPRIGAVSLPQSALVLQYEQTCKCFAARYVDILQGHFSHTPSLFGYSQEPSVLPKMPHRISCGLQVDALPLQREIQVASLFAFRSFLALMSSLRSVFVSFLRKPRSSMSAF
ncbi:hypothetical protein RYH73_20135 [Olivibacter sp. CPCC 100613]|uniref:hypothetical protein n=1 Tax=Olivibacter sp. CPCC 100613 TaxID=3079931 RepID=UPI002FFC1A38